MQTEEHFQAYFERKLSTTFHRALQIPRMNGRLRCSISWGRFGKIAFKMFPVFSWLFSYQFREWFLRDVHAGVSVGMFQIPQVLLGLWLTRLPLPSINGFLAAFSCSMMYVLFGTSRHISIGSFSILNVVATNVLSTLNFSTTLSFNGSQNNFSDPTFMKDSMKVLTLSASITLLTGILQLLLACSCLGFVTAYVPKTLVDAYLAAAALHVIVSQFTFIFDIMIVFRKGPMSIFYNLFHFLVALPKANATGILLFSLGVAALRASKSIRIDYKRSPVAFPMELVLIITVTLISNLIHFHAESSSAVVSVIPERFLPPTPPVLSNLREIILHAFPLAIVSYFLLVFVGERCASRHNYNIASNQDLIAVGLCNICSSFFKSFVVSCSVSGTVIQEKTGGKTQLAAAIGASVMLGIALTLGRFFRTIPNCILAAIVVFNVLPFLEKFLDVPILWKRDKYHFVIWLVTFAGVLCLGLDVGLVIAVAFTFFIVTVRSHRMKMVVLGQIPNTNIYRSLSAYRAAKEIEGIKIFQCCSSISFANMNCFKNYLLHKMDMKAVPLDESEMRAFISLSLSDTTVERKDLKCSCVCDPPQPPPRVPCTEKLVKWRHAGSGSSSSSLNSVRWSKCGDNLSSRTPLVGATQCPSDGLRTEKQEGEGRRTCPSPGSAIDNSSVQLEQPVPLPHPVHTIILDFSMVQFVDAIGSELLRQIIHMFHNIGITVLIAACHSSVIADFEKSDFFDNCVTKERFFLSLHDAVLAALDKHQNPDELEPARQEFAEDLQAEQQEETTLLLKKKRDFYSAKNSDNKFLRGEPSSETSYLAESRAEPSSLQQYDTPPLQSDFQDPGWGRRWNYSSNY